MKEISLDDDNTATTRSNSNSSVIKQKGQRKTAKEEFTHEMKEDLEQRVKAYQDLLKDNENKIQDLNQNLTEVQSEKEKVQKQMQKIRGVYQNQIDEFKKKTKSEHTDALQKAEE